LLIFFPISKSFWSPAYSSLFLFSRFFKLRSIFLLAFVQWIRNAGALLSRANVVLGKIEFVFSCNFAPEEFVYFMLLPLKFLSLEGTGG
jgi:hypothetical protein